VTAGASRRQPARSKEGVELEKLGRAGRVQDGVIDPQLQQITRYAPDAELLRGS
jgi:hypothetical protein